MPALYTLTINYDDGVEKCEISTSNTSGYTTIENGGYISIAGNSLKYFKITPKSGYSVDSVVSANYSIHDYGNNIWGWNMNSGGIDKNDVVTITTKATAPTYSFKHFYLDDELIGDGTYKFKHWSQVEKPKLATPTNLSISDSTLSWDEVENATSYDIYVDDVVVGTYVVEQALIASVTGLGNSDPTSVTFDVPSDFKFTDGEFTDSDGNVFVKIPKMYRKINATSDGQITSFSISNAKIDDDYKLYPVFLEEDGVTELDYVGIGKYMNKSSTKVNSVENGSVVSMTLGSARSNIKSNYSYGKYQLYDWMFHKLWQDLIICKMQTININSGSGITTDQLGIYWGNNYQLVDGFGHVDSYVYLCDKPSKYVDSPTASSDGYFTTSYRIATKNGQEIQKLGYDELHPFVNLPTAVISNSSYDTYFCDYYSYDSGNRPFYCFVGGTLAHAGAFDLRGYYDWTDTYGVRLCYRPIGE